MKNLGINSTVMVKKEKTTVTKITEAGIELTPTDKTKKPLTFSLRGVTDALRAGRMKVVDV